MQICLIIFLMIVALVLHKGKAFKHYQNNSEIIVDIENPETHQTQYHLANFETNAYNYGYDVGTNGQFHHETRGPDGITYGCYGYIDANKFLQVTHYVADSQGYRKVEAKKPVLVYPHFMKDNMQYLHYTNYKKNGILLNWTDLYFPIGCGMMRNGVLPNIPVIRQPGRIKPSISGAFTYPNLLQSVVNNISAYKPLGGIFHGTNNVAIANPSIQNINKPIIEAQGNNPSISNSNGQQYQYITQPATNSENSFVAQFVNPLNTKPNAMIGINNESWNNKPNIPQKKPTGHLQNIIMFTKPTYFNGNNLAEQNVMGEMLVDHSNYGSTTNSGSLEGGNIGFMVSNRPSNLIGGHHDSFGPSNSFKPQPSNSSSIHYQPISLSGANQPISLSDVNQPIVLNDATGANYNNKPNVINRPSSGYIISGAFVNNKPNGANLFNKDEIVQPNIQIASNEHEYMTGQNIYNQFNVPTETYGSTNIVLSAGANNPTVISATTTSGQNNFHNSNNLIGINEHIPGLTNIQLTNNINSNMANGISDTSQSSNLSTLQENMNQHLLISSSGNNEGTNFSGISLSTNIANNMNSIANEHLKPGNINSDKNNNDKIPEQTGTNLPHYQLTSYPIISPNQLSKPQISAPTPGHQADCEPEQINPQQLEITNNPQISVDHTEKENFIHQMHEPNSPIGPQQMQTILSQSQPAQIEYAEQHLVLGQNGQYMQNIQTFPSNNDNSAVEFIHIEKPGNSDHSSDISSTATITGAISTSQNIDGNQIDLLSTTSTQKPIFLPVDNSQIKPEQASIVMPTYPPRPIESEYIYQNHISNHGGHPVPGEPGTAIGVYPPRPIGQTSPNPTSSVSISNWPLFNALFPNYKEVQNIFGNCSCFPAQQNPTESNKETTSFQPQLSIELAQLRPQNIPYQQNVNKSLQIIGILPVFFIPYCTENHKITNDIITPSLHEVNKHKHSIPKGSNNLNHIAKIEPFNGSLNKSPRRRARMRNIKKFTQNQHV